MAERRSSFCEEPDEKVESPEKWICKLPVFVSVWTTRRKGGPLESFGVAL